MSDSFKKGIPEISQAPVSVQQVRARAAQTGRRDEGGNAEGERRQTEALTTGKYRQNPLLP